MIYETVILGAGESGIGAGLLAKAKGLNPFVSELKSIEQSRKEELVAAGIPFEEGYHSADIILQAGLIIKSPGIPDDVALLKKARNAGISIINELEFAFRYTKAKIIAITGTNGKTTTTLLTYHLLKTAGLKVGLAGNVGYSLGQQVIKDEFDYYVVEVSSFQLDGMYEFKANIAILLNITPDHLDRYGNKIENYIQSKFRITQNMNSDDSFVYFDDDTTIHNNLNRKSGKARDFPLSLNQQSTCPGHLKGDDLILSVGEDSIRISRSILPLIGKHNIVNSMAAMLAAKIIGISKEFIIGGLQTFKNAPHRLEKVAQIHGVEYINDSKATNVDAVYYALDGIDTSIIWIAGGIDKGNDYGLISELVGQKVKALICLGKNNEPLTSYFNDKVKTIIETQDIRQALETSQMLANSGDTVLLSPACSSFDLFNNYEHRGDRFKEEVMHLKSQNGHKKEVAL
ncbi:MAG: UDP-N-acetylmuramoyl-L-alanine--D-glutamate ligase [Bacteroidetes bacterium]|nr:UDP-N-acetylmuramoyl-L-alanine--D-glutamate ligase [Bacteroidota bacterium]MDA1121085.1 UDP-N-acetylmuramoyl-L-alanine--D-glutamate ligase [Bacteroidota bacterium]